VSLSRSSSTVTVMSSSSRRGNEDVNSVMMVGMEKCREGLQTADCRCEAGRGRLQKCKMRGSRAGGLRGALEAFLVGLAQQKTKEQAGKKGTGQGRRAGYGRSRESTC
jgi:hypothetical protein